MVRRKAIIISAVTEVVNKSANATRCVSVKGSSAVVQ